MLARFAEELSDVADVERPPALDGRAMTMTLAPRTRQAQARRGSEEQHRGVAQ